MNEILSEKDYQHEIIDYLKSVNGYRVRKNTNFDRNFAMDRELLFEFLKNTQPDVMDELYKIYKKDAEETIVNVINQTVTSNKGSLVETLKNGIEISNRHLDLMYAKPATTFNRTLNKKYNENIFSVAEEILASDKERIDLVIFLNGIAIISFELKCNTAGQSYHNAILQYRTERNPKNRLFLFKAGCIVNFAMDLEQVYMATKLDGEATTFLPFNMGNGEGVNTGAGNPAFKDKYSVSYMWEDILTKDTILDLISKYIFVERKEEIDEITGKKKKTESVIFPRYHQLDLIRKLLASVKEHKTELNYLIQHSAGSGKTNSIAWLTYRLASLHDEDDNIIFDNIIIITDRVVVDRQLQKAILGMDHKAGLIRVMDDRCTSADLANELTRNTKIIATTIQKFPYIVDNVANLKDKKFAVIIDEAHSSTAGKDMMAVTQSLGSGDRQYEDVDDMINDQIEKSGKQPNVSMFAFTATPKRDTLRLFGKLNKHGQHEAFHLYSMKQAIEEGYILDVLLNFTEYQTMCTLNKNIEDDPMMKTDDAKRQITRFKELHDTNIAQRVEIIVEHFRNVVMGEIGGMAKAMVVTSSRQAAVKYHKAFKDYIARREYTGIDALVAFSGKVKLEDDDTEYTETGMNGFREEQTPNMFDTDAYNVLIVANKYQTGFDQKKLCAMYVLKKLKGVNAVQTFSRLNRICPPFDKRTFILDFVNTYSEVQASFSTYYTTTILSGNIEPGMIYEKEAKIDAYMVIDPIDLDQFNEMLFKKREKSITDREKKAMTFYLQRSANAVRLLDYENQKVLISEMRKFVRLYDFLIQASCFTDADIHRKYTFISYLLSYLDISYGGRGFDLTGKLKATDFVQKKGETHTSSKEKTISNPIIKLPESDGFNFSEAAIKRLSEIIDEINARTGKKYDADVVVKATLQIRDLLMKSEKLKKSAKSNTRKDFEFSFYDDIDDALIEGLEQNNEFFTLLLNNDEFKRSVLGIFAGEIYNSLRNSA